MIDLYFKITPQNFLYRVDSQLIKNQREEEYICHFIFEGEDWQDKQKFVTFSIKNKEYTSSLNEENEYSSPIPYAALTSCIVHVKVHCDDIITRNQVSLVVSQPKEEIIYECKDQTDYHDIYADAFNEINTKFDNAQLDGNDMVFYANGQEISRISLDTFGHQANWAETDEFDITYIQNKPSIINNFRYENDNLICLEDDEVKQTVSLKHNHQSTDVVDFDEEVDIDLNNLLISITENIRSL